MRHFFLSGVFCIATTIVFSQSRITGHILDTSGEPVDYVNIGFSGTALGVTSNGEGRFTFSVPDSLAGHDLVFSHVSFEPLTVPVGELLSRMASGEGVEIRLTERSVSLSGVEVLSGRAKYKRIGASHLTSMKNGFLYGLLRVHNIDPAELPDPLTDDLSEGAYNPEAMSPIPVKEEMLLCELAFPVVNMPYDSLLVRLNIYLKQGEDFTPLNIAPIYSMVPYTQSKEYYEIDVRADDIVLTPAEYYAGIEILHGYGYKPGEAITLPAHLGSGYIRNGVDKFEKAIAHPGIQVLGRLLSK